MKIDDLVRASVSNSRRDVDDVSLYKIPTIVIAFSSGFALASGECRTGMNFGLVASARGNKIKQENSCRTRGKQQPLG